MNATRLAALLLTAAMVVATAAPAATAASQESLAVTAEQSPETGTVTVSVAQNGSAVADAAVAITSTGAYAGNGTYETDANGTVELPNPERTVEVTLDVTADGQNATETVELVPLNDSLAVAVDQESSEVVVTVSQYGTPVENATVDVNASGYAGAGEYTTDANGTVALPTPNESVNATVAATADDLRTETTVRLDGRTLELDVSQDDAGNVSVVVTRNDTGVENATVTVDADGYAGAGTHQTDANGTVELPAPEETVNATVAATADGETVRTTVELTTTDEATEPAPFGLRVSSFVQNLLDGDREGGIGQAVSEFVRGNNPGNANGPGEKGNATADERRGPPEQAKGNGTSENASQNGDRGEKPERPENRGNTTDEHTPRQSPGDDTEADDDGNGNAGGDRGGAPEHANGGKR